MKSIITRYHGPGNVRGSRITATDSDKHNRISISLEPEWSHDEAHRQAALALCRKLRWKGILAQGGNGPDSEVFVFLTDDNQIQV